MRILAVTNMWPTSTHHRGNVVEDLVRSVRALGHEVDVEVVVQDRNRLDYVLAIPRVRRLAQRGQYDVVHLHFGMTALAGRFAGIPRVLSLYGSDINVPWKRWFTKLGAGRSARVYVSRRLAEAAGDPGGTVIPNGVDFRIFVPGDRSAARAALKLRPEVKVVLFGGAPQVAVKGFDVFEAVLGAVRSRGVEVAPLVLTEPGMNIRQVVAKMDAADALLFTSRAGSEGSPTVVKEAIVMGLPVVSVDVGDVGELLAGIHPSAVVRFPDAEAAASGAEVTERLANALIDVLAADRRADGRRQRGWLDLPAIAGRTVMAYRTAVEAQATRWR